MNFTVVPPGPLGYITVYPAGQAQPLVSTLNSLDGRVLANGAIVSARSGGGINVYSTNQTDLIVDIAGYFAPGNGVTSKVFNTIYPCRPVNVALFSADVAVPVGGTCGVPGDAAGFAINMTAAMNQPVGYFSVWPTGQAWPGVSLMNAIDAIPGSKVGNGAIVPAGTSGQVNLRAAGGSATATVDLTGYFSSASSSNLPPVISRQTVVVTSSGATIAWATNEPADTQLFIGGASTSNFSFTMQHLGTLAGLLPSTTYSYEVRSRDVQGAQSVKTGTLRTADAQPTVTSASRLTGASGVSVRWEPTSARGSQSWALGWWELIDGCSYVSSGPYTHIGDTDTGSWQTPPQLLAPLNTCNGTGLFDLNLKWDPVRNRFVYVGGTAGGGIYYGYSMNSQGTNWSTPVQVLAPGGHAGTNVSFWDYPSIAIDRSGRILIGAGAVQPPGGSGGASVPQGYFAALVDPNFPTLVSASRVGTSGGSFGRVAATNGKFHAFLFDFNAANLPIKLSRFESLDGITWPIVPNFLPQVVSEFAAPRNLSTPPSGFPVFFAAQHLAVDSVVDPSNPSSDGGYWAAAFQGDVGGRNNSMICASHRGCGYIYSTNQTDYVSNDQFYPGVSILPDGTLWHTYTTYSTPPQAVAPLEIHAWTIGPGQQFGATRARQNMFPEGWRLVNENRCGTGFCYAAGDFLTISADSQRVLVPFIEGRPATFNPNFFDFNDLWQMFVRPQSQSFSANSRAGGATISWSPLGTSFRSRGQAHGQVAPPPGARVKR